MKITKELLVRKHACRGQVDLFAELFPEGVVITESICLAHATEFDWDWAARKLLQPPAREACVEACALARKTCDEACAPARKACDEAHALARKACDEACALAFARAAEGDAE